MEIGNHSGFNPVSTDTRVAQSAAGTLQDIGNQAKALQNSPAGSSIVDLINDLVNQLQGNSGGNTEKGSLDDLLAGLQKIITQLQSNTGQGKDQAEQEQAAQLTLEIMKMSVRMGIIQQGALQKELLDMDVSYS